MIKSPQETEYVAQKYQPSEISTKRDPTRMNKLVQQTLDSQMLSTGMSE